VILRRHVTAQSFVGDGVDLGLARLGEEDVEVDALDDVLLGLGRIAAGGEEEQGGGGD
jgi:hypothetical protein